ncbi:HlyC/CorC family transporter [Candidatus Poribacteria bacterium]|nr:HlyC/CorC family transporter [Candidatus Poribacteria bacterium]
MMDISSFLPHLIGLALLLGLSAFFSGSETAMFSLTKLQVQRLRERTDGASRAVVRFYQDLRRLLVTVLIGNNLVNIAFSSITGSLFIGLMGSTKGVTAAVIFNLLMLLTFGEITPKVYALKHPQRFALKTARPLWLISIFLFPAYWILKLITDLIMPKGMEFNDTVTPDEIKALLSAGAEEGEFEERERELIQLIFELRDIEAHEIMIPRTDMICAQSTERIGDILNKAKEHGVSRVPIYRKSLDDICGIFYAKDLPIWRGFDVMDMTAEFFMTVREELLVDQSDTLIRRPHFVPESRRVSELLRDFSRFKTHMVILVDEYGGTSGLVTLEDVIEEIVGDIVDEYDEYRPQREMIKDLGGNRYEVSGRTPVRLINRTLSLKLDEEAADTMGGYVINLLGRIPKAGEVVEIEDLRIEVEKIEGMRVETVILSKLGGKGGKTKGIISLLVPLLLLASSSWATSGSTPQSVLWQAIPFSIIALILVGFRAFYAGSETAFVSANRMRLRALAEDGEVKAARALSLFSMPEEILTMTLIGTNLMGISATQMAVLAAKSIRPHDIAWQSSITTAVMTPLILLFGEIIPKSIFRAKANSIMMRAYLMIRGSHLAFYPVVKVFTSLSSKLASAVKGEEESDARRSELRLLTSMGEQEGVILPRQRQMIHSVLDLHRKTVGQVMVPLVEMISLRKGTSISDFLDMAARYPYSRYPIYRRRIDDIVGIVHVLDVIYSGDDEGTIDRFIRRDLTFVPELKRVDTFLREFQHKLLNTPKEGRNPMAFVVDEYGGVVGLVTIEDLIEEIIGNIQSERGGQSHLISMDERSIICDGRMEIEELNMRFNLQIPEGNYETVAGYLISLRDGVPRPGEVIDTDTLRFIILNSDERTIRKVKIVNKTGRFPEELT